jgi:hypothetical protein
VDCSHFISGINKLIGSTNKREFMEKIISPNDWLKKAGARLEGNELILPINCFEVSR